jgi:hypothetical protein
MCGLGDHGCRARKQARQGRVRSNRATVQENINKTNEYHIHTSKQNIGISVGLYKIHDPHTRTRGQKERART